MSVLGTEFLTPGPGDGAPGHFTLPGTGFSVPAGLEAVLEFNGLFMNIQENVDRIRVTSIDGLFDADVRDVRDVRSDADGECPYNSLYGGRTIVIGGTIQTYTVGKMRDLQMALRASFADIRNEYPLHFRVGDYTKDHFINCKKIAPIAGIEQQTSLRAERDFQISLRASNPRFLSYTQNLLDADLPGSMINTPLLVGNAHNRGDYWAQPIYRIYGKATRTTIINDTTGKRFSVGFIEAGDYLEFDLTKASPTLQNSRGENSWLWLNDDSDYVELQGGVFGSDNEIYYSGDATRVEIRWRDSWI
jgi:hypothetical protein